MFGTSGIPAASDDHIGLIIVIIIIIIVAAALIIAMFVRRRRATSDYANSLDADDNKLDANTTIGGHTGNTNRNIQNGADRPSGAGRHIKH